ncbi:MAG: hypothetical protein ACF8R9_07415 [Phycisphaerales bacterium JB054]
MATTPRRPIDKVEFYETRIDPWAAHAAAIGLTEPAVTQLAALTVEAREAHADMLAARQAAMAATERFHNAVAAMHGGPGAGSDMLAAIKNHAETTDDAGVYALAQVPPPKTRSAVPPPGTPTRFRVKLLQDGAIELAWDCNNPARSEGTVYEVRRSIGGVGGGPMTLVATVGQRKFLDRDIPAAALAEADGCGGGRVTYQITALRSTARGTPAQHTVRFGTRGGGAARPALAA